MYCGCVMVIEGKEMETADKSKNRVLSHGLRAQHRTLDTIGRFHLTAMAKMPPKNHESATTALTSTPLSPACGRGGHSAPLATFTLSDGAELISNLGGCSGMVQQGIHRACSMPAQQCRLATQ